MTLEFFYDVGSPYSYLAAMQVDDFAADHALELRWRPFLLGAVFKETGNAPPARVPAKAAWMVADLAEWARLLGVALRIPASFPTNTLYAQRALVAVDRRLGQDALQRASLALFGAYWGQGRDVADPEVIADALRLAEIDPAAIAADMQTPEVKDALREQTDEAVRRGAFGAPTFFVGDAMFFGSDRFDLIAHHLESAP